MSINLEFLNYILNLLSIKLVSGLDGNIKEAT